MRWPLQLTGRRDPGGGVKAGALENVSRWTMVKTPYKGLYRYSIGRLIEDYKGVCIGIV